MVRIGFTGTQEGMSPKQAGTLFSILWRGRKKGIEFHHGDCIGADEEADKIARSVGASITIHPPEKDVKRAFCYREGDTLLPVAPYMTRNQRIVDSVEMLIAAPKTDTEEVRSGTWATVRMARRRGIPIKVLPR